jgi:type IV pilus assembly protein PilB
VRFRVDGELREITQPPLAIKDKLASRIKVISRLDISEKRVPQDGRMKLRFGNKSIDFRVSTLPTLFGEKIVIRILDPSSAKLGIEALGYEPAEKERLLHAITALRHGAGDRPDRLGQDGVALHLPEHPEPAGREHLHGRRPGRNQPAGHQPGQRQRQGRPDLRRALKSFLRQDPDIIMVGEIRDLETADIAIKAAQTGHLVLSTLHTNDAPPRSRAC